MVSLIKKDFMIQKRNFIIVVVFIVFITLVAKLGFEFVLTVIAVPYILILGACELEEKNKGSIILISLPIKRSTIILAKYISIFVFIAFSVLVNFTIHGVVIIFDLPITLQTISCEAIITSFAGAIVYCSILLPLTYKFNVMAANVVGVMLLVALLALGGSLIEKFTLLFYDSATTVFTSYLFIAIFLVIIMLLSYVLSLAFFKQREF